MFLDPVMWSSLLADSTVQLVITFLISLGTMWIIVGWALNRVTPELSAASPEVQPPRPIPPPSIPRPPLLRVPSDEWDQMAAALLSLPPKPNPPPVETIPPTPAERTRAIDLSVPEPPT